QRMRLLAQRNGITLNSLMLSSVNILLSKYTGQDDIVIGSVMANRHYMQTEGLIGFFVNTQVNRTQLTNSQSFEALMQQVHQEQINTQLHQDLPFEKLIDELGVERDMSRHPVFQIMFMVRSFNNQNKKTEQQKEYFKPYEIESDSQTEKLDLSITIDDSQDELRGLVSYATSLFCKTTITKFIKNYIFLLEKLVEKPTSSYSDISIIDSADYKEIVHNWNATEKEYPKEKTIQELFEEQVAKTPNKTALVFENKSLSYNELNEKSNQLAHYIRVQYEERVGKTFVPNTLIALCLDRSLEMIIGMLAVLKAGGAYVPIDSNYPQDRIDYILEDTKVEFILIRKNNNNSIQLPQDRIICIDLKEELYSNANNNNFNEYSKSDDLAYVIYTSGTTGKPKGVELTHSNLNNLTFNIIEAFDIDEQTISSQIISTSFDGAVSEIYPTLIAGGTLHIISEEIKQNGNLMKHIASEEITHLTVPADLLESFEYLALNKLKTIHVGGGVNSVGCLNRWSNGRKLINAYGPTEGTVYTTMHQYREGDLNTKIGKPINNTNAYVLDSNNAPVPVGVIGELYIGGASLSRGYLNRPDLTAERFIENPFATEADKAKGYTRLYKTG
ncbi:amino acid adenylation domain-containing protein, partial [Flavobacterium sp. LS1R47]